MVAVRNMRFEFTRFGVEMEYLTMNLVKDFAKILGFDPDQLLDKLKSANQWVISNMPEITGWIEERLTPALNDVKLILSDTWDLLKLSGVAFSNLVGAISGDKSLEGTAANFDKISSAIQKSLDGITNFTSGIIHSEEVLLHLVNAASLAKSGNMKEAMGELNTAWKMYSSGSLEAGLGKAAGTFGFAFGPSNQKLMQDVGTLFGGAIEDYRGKSPIAGAAPEYARSAAIALGLPPGADKWILAQEKFETANFTSPATMRNNLGGIMDMRHGGGIKPFGTLDDYNSEYIKTVMGDIKRFGKTPQSMDEFVQMLYAGGKKAYVQSGTPQDYLAGMQRYSGGDQSVQIDNLTIHVAGTNATPDQIKKATTEGISAAVSKQVQRNIQEFAGAYQ
jgi:hypothetical protein